MSKGSKRPGVSKIEDFTAEELLERLSQMDGAPGALGEAGLLAYRKGKDYNASVKRTDYFPMGLASYAQMLHVKSMRLVSLATAHKDPVNEKVRDTGLDIISYASFLVGDYLDEIPPEDKS
jgi:hypothetical protein